MSMIFGGILGHLWKDLGKQNSAESINQLLDYDKDCTVQKLMDDDHTLIELRNNNQKLINYFTHEKVIDLLRYIVIEPDQDCTYKRGHRFPFVASDLLGVQQNSMLDAFFKETQLRIPIQKTVSALEKVKQIEQSPTSINQEKESENSILSEENELEHEEDEQKQDQIVQPVEVKQNNEEEEQEKLQENEPQKLEEVQTIVIPSPKAQKESEEEQQQEVVVEKQIKEPEIQNQKQLPNEQQSQKNSEEIEIEEPVVPQKFISQETKPIDDNEEKDNDADQQVQQPESSPPQPSVQESLPQLQDIIEPSQQEAKDDLIPLQLNDQEEQKMTTITGSTLADTQQQFQVVIKVECLELLFSFLSDTSKQLNPVLCGYFSRIVNSLLNKRLKLIAEYIFSHFQILQNMVSHLEARSIYELVIRILKIDESIFDFKELEVDMHKARIISCLLEQLSSNNTKWQNLNSSQVLCEIIQNSKLWSIVCTNGQFSQTVVKNIINPGSTSSLHSSMKVFGSMLSVCGKWKTSWQKALCNMQEIDYESAMKFVKNLEQMKIEYQDNFDYDNEQDQVNGDDSQNDTKQVLQIEGIFEKIFELYNGNHNLQAQLLNCSYGRDIIPFGKTRLLVSKIFKSCVQIQCAGITGAIMNSKVLQKLMNFVQIYEWNNMLHVFADGIFTFILSSIQNSVNNTTFQLKKHLLFELKFVDWVAQLSTVPKFEFYSNRKTRTGYMPFVNKFSNQLVKLSENNEEINNLLNESQAFMAYKNGDLSEMNDINSRPLGGLKTGQNNEDEKGINEQKEEEKDDMNVSFSVDDIYKQYNELSARYNSKRSSTASSIDSDSAAATLQDEEDQQDEQEDFDVTSESPTKKSQDNDYDDDENQKEEQGKKFSIKLGTQDNQQDIYQYEDYQKRFTETMNNITSEQDDGDEYEYEDAQQQQQQQEQEKQSLSSLFMDKKLMKNRQNRNIRPRYQQQEDEQYEDDMNDRDQETDQLFKYAQQVSSSDQKEEAKKINKSLNPFESPDEEVFVSDNVKCMSFGDKKLHLELFQTQSSSPEKNIEYYSNNYWKVDVNKNYDIDELLKDFI